MPPVMRPPRKGVAYSEALTKAYASNDEDEVTFDTLEFLHPTFLDTSGNPMGIRVVCDNEDLNAFLEDDAPLNPGEEVLFSHAFFAFKRQAETESGQVPQVELQVDNVARILIPYLDMAKESRTAITVIWRPYLESDLSGPHMNPVLTLVLSNVTGDMNSLNARAGFVNLTNRRFPASEYTSRKFPELSVR